MDIETMPRGGFDASWLDRRMQTDRPEYLDRDDVDDRVKRQVIRSLDWMGRVLRDHEHFAERTLKLVADIPDPAILELGAGHGGLSRKLLEMHPTARVTVTDIDPISVSNIASGDLGSHPRAIVRVMDATDVDAPDRSYDLALFVLSFHHLRPAAAARVLAEGTRAARQASRHRPGPAARSAAPDPPGGVLSVCARPALRPRRAYQLVARLQPIGIPGAGRSRRSDHRRRVQSTGT